MKKTRQLASVAGAIALVTGAASLTLLGGGSATAAGVPSSAYGIDLSIAGNAVLDKMPSVESADGALVEDSLVPLPVHPLLDGGVLNASAKNGAATANVTGLKVGDGLLDTLKLPANLTDPLNQACTQVTTALQGVTGPISDAVKQLLPGVQDLIDKVADATAGTPLNLSGLGALDITKLTDPNQITALCDVLSGDLAVVGATAVEAKCTGNTGTTTIADLKALGLPVNVDTKKANQAVKVFDIAGVPPVVELIVNRQTKNADGTFTVDALYVNILDQIKLTVASATCGKVTKDKPDTPDDNNAPSPTPVQTHVPVTG